MERDRDWDFQHEVRNIIVVRGKGIDNEPMIRRKSRLKILPPFVNTCSCTTSITMHLQFSPIMGIESSRSVTIIGSNQAAYKGCL